MSRRVLSAVSELAVRHAWCLPLLAQAAAALSPLLLAVGGGTNAR